jgi:hypothetical protein
MTRVVLATLALAVPVCSQAAETVVRFNLRPMPAPKPALKYQLLPEVRELNPGNPAQNYLKCFAEQRNFFFSKEATAERARYLSLPLAQLPADKLLRYGSSALRQADWAARLDTLDWQMLRHVQIEGTDLPLPELGLLQLLGPALQVRFRAEVAAHKFADAVNTAKTMLALARHLGEHPTEAANLMGFSVAQLAFGTLEEMVQQPGCPNLYWALTDLPSPLVELRKGLQGDRAQVAADLRLLRDDAPMTEEQLECLLSRLSGAIGFAREQAGLPPRSLRVKLAERVKDPDRVRAARGRLSRAGHPDDAIQKLPPLLVILLDERNEYEACRDERMKVLALAPWQIDALTDRGVRETGDGVFADFLPHVITDRLAQARLERRVALLRQMEALRLYAAEHDGRLPESLQQIQAPLPVDPFTGKPFAYRVDKATAQLCGPPPRGEESNSCFHIRYEVTMGK